MVGTTQKAKYKENWEHCLRGQEISNDLVDQRNGKMLPKGIHQQRQEGDVISKNSTELYAAFVRLK